MTISIVPTLHDSRSVSESNSLSYCTLQWRRNQLLVKSSGKIKQPYMPLLDTHESLKECLQHSSVELVRIDPKLGEEKVKLWADACMSASKPIYLCISTARKQLNPNGSLLWWLKRSAEWIIASLFLVIVSPLMLLLASVMKIEAQAPLFKRSWHVGERGKLFKLVKYNTSQTTSSQLRNWMRKYGLDNLPQLLNVLRGEMGLFGSRYWTLEDAVRLNPEAQKQLNNRPGITGSWEVEAEETNILHLDSQIS